MIILGTDVLGTVGMYLDWQTIRTLCQVSRYFRYLCDDFIRKREKAAAQMVRLCCAGRNARGPTFATCNETLFFLWTRNVAPQDIAECFKRIGSRPNPYQWLGNLNESDISIPWCWEVIGDERKGMLPHLSDVVDSLYIRGRGITKVRIHSSLRDIELFRSYHVSNGVVAIRFPFFIPVVSLIYDDIAFDITARSIHSVQARYGSLNRADRILLHMTPSQLITATGQKVLFADGYVQTVADV